MSHRGVRPNKELERTRSTQTAVGPRRSIQCWADNGGTEGGYPGPGEEMESNGGGRSVLATVILWTARIWAAASVGLVLAFLVGEGFHPSQIKTREWLGLVFFPVGICAGMILAWWKAGLGGAITVGSLLVFYVIHFATAGTFPRGWAFLVFAAPGFLFLLYWAQCRMSVRRDGRSGSGVGASGPTRR